MLFDCDTLDSNVESTSYFDYIKVSDAFEHGCFLCLNYGTRLPLVKLFSEPVHKPQEDHQNNRHAKQDVARIRKS